ncbi:alpha/beta fold hydrolase [Novosphingobium beihaiensis]|uniref:Alpha/beta hydrolase n=1 Tax=Novosphingobium beihaiensis TaxID=2930389 RepID=A0ABT0BJR7_9SPHN|nr:alpha/beta fold hydrolase [Novosphingobium beihaiensis]MCJ2185290.1 alpha/beta hydrolase [Novosphingobium beihaiensis]
MGTYMAGSRRNYAIEFGEGRPLLLLHGISNTGRAWAPQVPALAGAGYRVIVPDHAGHGASAPVTTPFGVSELADDIEIMLAAMDIANCDIVGLSLGGMVALELALRRPERVGRMIVANSFDCTATPTFAGLAESWARTFEQPQGPLRRFEANWPSLVSPAFQTTAEGLRTYQVWHALAAVADGPSLANVSRGITTFDVSQRIAELAMPTLFIAGGLDGMSPPDLGRALAERAPQGEFSLIGEAAHISNVDTADAFTRRVLEFL